MAIYRHIRVCPSVDQYNTVSIYTYIWMYVCTLVITLICVYKKTLNTFEVSLNHLHSC